MIEGTKIKGKKCTYVLGCPISSVYATAHIVLSGELGSISSQAKVLVRQFGKSVLERKEAEKLVLSENAIELIETSGSLFLITKIDESFLKSLRTEKKDSGVNDELTDFSEEADDGFVYFEEGKYLGEIENGVPHGKGKMFWNDHSVYDGEWVAGLMEGTGTMTWPSGKLYNGNWLHGEINGYGEMTDPNGTIYEGQFLNGKRHGRGVLTQFNGEKYEGEFVNNKATGNGCYYNHEGQKRGKMNLFWKSQTGQKIITAFWTIVFLCILGGILIILFVVAN